MKISVSLGKMCWFYLFVEMYVMFYLVCQDFRLKSTVSESVVTMFTKNTTHI